MIENGINCDPKKAVIIGGGVAGLAAAWELSNLRPWWKVVLVEQDSSLGGLAATWDVNGWKVDLGPHRWYTEVDDMLKLEKSLLPSDCRITQARRSQMVLGGKLIDYPPRIMNLVRAMGLSTVMKLGFSALSEWVAPSLERPENFVDATRVTFGKYACDLISSPYAEKTWKTKPEELSAEIARVRISTKGGLRPSALNEITYFSGGICRIPEHMENLCLAQGVKIVKNTRVDALQAHENNPRLIQSLVLTDTSNRGSEASESDVDYVISTLPLTQLLGCISQSNRDLLMLKAVDHLQYLGLILVAVEIGREKYSENTWVYYPDKELMFNRSYEPGNFDPAQRRPDRSMVVFDVTSKINEAPWTVSDDEILKTVKGQLCDNHLLEENEICDMHILRVPFAYPLYQKNYETDLQVVLNRIFEFDNLVTTGRQGLFNHNNMDHSIVMGVMAARCICEQGASGHLWRDSYLPKFSGYRIVD